MRDKLEDAFLRLRAAAHADEYVPMEDVIEFVLKLSEAGRAALAKLAERDALCEQQTRTIALTSERAVKAEKERDEVGIQLAAAQAEIGRLKERFEEIAKADKLVVDLNEVTNALSAAHTREAIARAENERLRAAAEEVLSWPTKDMAMLLSNPPQNAALFRAQSVLRKALEKKP